MNLSVKKGLGVQGIEAVLGKCRKIVGHFNHSQPKYEALKCKQKQLGMPEKTLKQEVETRWNSTYDMLTSILDSDEAIASILRSETKSASLLLTPEDVINLRSIQKWLAPWKKLTVFMSAEHYPTISFVAPSLHKLLSTALESKMILN